MAESLQQLLVTNFGLSPSGYTGSQGEVGYVGSAGTNGYTGSAGASGTGILISNIQVTDSSYTVLDDTAVDVAGGYIKITGSGFVSGCSVLINQTAATSVTFISSTEVRAQLSATVAGTYIVYLVNNSGDVAIRVNGVTFSATPTWTTGSGLSGGVGTALSIQLTASSAATYALQAGSSLPSGVTLSNVGLISGTVTGISSETIYNFTVVATDSESQDSPRSFALTITVGDPYFKYATLLLSANGSMVGNTAVRPFNTDVSTNNFGVVATGDARADTFNPHQEGYYSVYFDGTGDYLSVPSTAALQLSAVDFTIESWIYLTATPSAQFAQIIGRTEYGTNADWMLQITNDNRLTFYSGSTASFIVTSTAAISLNAWTHVAASRSGNSFKLFINGIVDGTVTNAGFVDATGSGDYTIGTDQAGDEVSLTGYISNLRVVKGTAVYTTNFTPSTAPLTAISGTSLLTCQSNRFIDNSTNALAITRYGNTSVRAAHPFTLPSSMETYGSGYFDGTGDGLQLPSSANFLLVPTIAWTLEAWIYPTTNYTPVFWQNGGAQGTLITHTDRGRCLFGGTTGSGSNDGAIGGNSTVCPANTWSHVAITCDGNYNFYISVNGVRGNAVNRSGENVAYSRINLGYIGSQPDLSSFFLGYISNARVVNGTAVYTANFTPSATPLTAVTNTQVLTAQFNGTSNNNLFRDSSINNFAVTRVGNPTQGTFSPYGANWSNYFNGTSQLSFASNAGYAFGTGDFTVECWYFATSNPGYRTLIETRASNGTNTGWTLAADSTGAMYVYSNGFILTGINVVLNTWNHVAFTRNGSTQYLFLNGVLVNSTTTARTYSDTNLGVGGVAYTTGEYWTGYLSNVRLIKGTCLYTSAFTPSATPLTAVTNTTMLTCQSNRFIDSSTTNATITASSNMTVQRFSPFGAGAAYSTTAIGGSAYFDGSGDYLDITSANCLLTGDFTVEAWVCPTSWGSYQRVISGGTSTFYWSLGFSTTWGGGLKINWFDGADYYSSAPASIPLNTWYHLAVVRTGSTIYYYINGVLNGTSAYSATPGNASGGITIGRRMVAGEPWYGYITDARVVVGTNMYGTGATCTVPTTPLTAVANTRVLFSGTNAGIVDSTMQNVLETVGDTKISVVQSKFGGASVYFDGTGDYCFIPNTHAFLFGGSDFTIELWIYFSNTTDRKYVLGPGTDTASHYKGFGIEIWGQQLCMWASSNGSGWNMLDCDNAANKGATLMAANTWHHIAVTRSGNTFRSFVNGVVEKTFTVSGSIFSDVTIPYNIGRVAYNGGTFFYNGYMDDFRVTRGYARYTANFTPSTTALLAQ